MTKSAGVREVKNHLSAFLQQVRRGVVVRITDRGRVVAELRSPPSNAEVDPYERLVEEGAVIPPARNWSAALVPTLRGSRRLARGLATDLVNADRDEW